MEDFTVFSKIPNDTRRDEFYHFQKNRNSKVNYGSFLKSYENYHKALTKIQKIQEKMLTKYGHFNLYLNEKYKD